jgi:adenosine kinase
MIVCRYPYSLNAISLPGVLHSLSRSLPAASPVPVYPPLSLLPLLTRTRSPQFFKERLANALL